MTDITTAEREVRSALNATADDPDYAGAWDAFNRILAELDRLRAENDALREDAERYRWLCNFSSGETDDYGNVSIEFHCDFEHYADLDASIDAARKGE